MSDSEQRFSLHGLTESQLRVLKDSLDLMSRLLCAQVDELEYFFRVRFPGRIQNIDSIIQELKCSVFPELDTQSFYGIGSPSVPMEAKNAYDLLCVIRNGLAWWKNPNGGFTVDFDPPLHMGEEPLITFKVDE